MPRIMSIHIPFSPHRWCHPVAPPARWRAPSDVQPPSKKILRSIRRRRVLSTYSHKYTLSPPRSTRALGPFHTAGDIRFEIESEMPPGPGVADVAAPPRSPHRGGGVTPQSPLRIMQDGKFYERLLTKDKESSATGNLSFRYYWAEPGAVPFVWESQPGTPKDVARMAAAGALPAITPPPSYLLRHGNGGCRQAAARHGHQKSGSKQKRRRCRLKRIRIGFIAGIFRRLSLGKTWRRRSTSPPVRVSSSSSRWLFSSVATDTGEHNNLHHQDEIAVAAAHATAAKAHKAVPCSFPATPWLLRFCASSGNRGGGATHGWA
ncbi:hypothetical protein HU200_004889 [Digitaria exilis]|uniref:Uncharacterized protein n=1 Tax=Digitaria exilis TaxID=1010633 RepID=A0A835FS44_9POAL|nr:hypothetical protein HU200_004889 [Digitaria exilis]